MRLIHLKRFLAALLLSLILLSASACAFLDLGQVSYFTELSESKAVLEQGSILPQNKDCQYASDYLAYWGMPSFQPTKLITVEKFYHDYYIGTLPDLYTLSEEVYNLYREYFNGRPDFNERMPENVTAALISCFQEAAGDRYAVYMDADSFGEYNESFQGDYVGTGIYVQHDYVRDETVVLNVFENSPAKDAGLLAGDIILSVNEVPLSGATYDQAFAMMKGKEGDRVALRVRRGQETLTLTLTLRKIESYTVSFRLLAQDESIACIKIEEFNAKTAEQFKKAYDAAVAAGAKKLIFDLRDNPGGEINAIADVLDYLLPDGGPIAHFRYKEGSPLESEDTTFYADDGHKCELPMAVLCNGGTASAGELFTAALRDYKVATVVGETTYGKGTMQNMISLPDGSAFTVSIAKYDPPYGENYEGVGITPHVEVSLPEEIEGINAFLRNDEDDTQLQAAVHELGGPLV